MIEVTGMTSFVAIMTDPKTGEQKTYNNMKEALEAEKSGEKLVSCAGHIVRK